MDLKGEKFAVSISAGELTDDSLRAGIAEMLEVAQARGLEIPAVAGSVAVENVANQRQVLATMQAGSPDLKGPSVLDDVAYW